MTDRVIFFVDWENLYMGAGAFHPDAGRRTPEGPESIQSSSVN